MRISAMLVLGTVAAISACSHEEAARPATQPNRVAGAVVTVQTHRVASALEAAGIARPIAEATLSTRLMATVKEVRVHEGDRVTAGQILAVLDARDLIAKDAQIEASLAEAEAMKREAETNVRRLRALYAEDAAPRAQLDAAETGFARASAAVSAARAGAAELTAVRDYSVIRAPFSGIVTRRFVDPGAFAAPGAPLLHIQDTRRLRIAVTATPEAVRELARGDTVAVRIEGVSARAIVEGAVPAAASIYTVNAIVDNARGHFLPGSAASIALPLGMRVSLLVPTAAVHREGDLTGVLIQNKNGNELRWVRLGAEQGDNVEVVAGVREGERVVVPNAVGAR